MAARRCMVCGRFARGVFVMAVLPGLWLAWSHIDCSRRLGARAVR